MKHFDYLCDLELDFESRSGEEEEGVLTLALPSPSSGLKNIIAATGFYIYCCNNLWMLL